ncbi:hypothetical protein [Nostoc sp.]|uniref:hypothetical protein n=1 Tax=Nostoc sp. TaxID=1180 RepID=UPI002FFA5418
MVKGSQEERRTARKPLGIYQSLFGIKINADTNGAANILRKVSVMLGLDLSGISRGCLSQPKKVLLWTLQKSPRLQAGEA